MKRLLAETLNAGLIVPGILSAGMGLKGFLLSSNFIDGRVTGASMLLARMTPLPLARMTPLPLARMTPLPLARMTPLPLAVWLPAVGLSFIVIGYRQIGRAFALRSAPAISALGAERRVRAPGTRSEGALPVRRRQDWFSGANVGIVVGRSQAKPAVQGLDAPPFIS